MGRNPQHLDIKTIQASGQKIIQIVRGKLFGAGKLNILHRAQERIELIIEKAAYDDAYINVG
jgi:hypothetical protein